MYFNRTLEIIAPAIGERDEYLSPPVRVEVYRDGYLDTGLVSGLISLSLEGTDPVLYPGDLTGTKTVQVSRGVTTFNPLSINIPGEYELTAQVANDELQQLPSSPTSGSLRLWKIILPPTITADPTQRGWWINVSGSGVPIGIWGKIVADGWDSFHERYYWEVEQPADATSFGDLPASGLFSIRYNSANPTLAPANILSAAANAWFLWDPTSGTYLDFRDAEQTGQILTKTVTIEVLRHVSIKITGAPTQARVGENHAILAVVKNQNGTIASDLTYGSAAAVLQIRSGLTPVYESLVPVVNGYVFKTVPMPATEGTYSIWVSYQGLWYRADEVTDEQSVLVSDVEEPEEPPPTPEEPPPKFPPEEYTLQAGGCAVIFHISSFLELEASDSYLEVLVK